MNQEIKQGHKGTLAEALPHLIRDRGWEKQLDLYSLFVHWEKIIDRTTTAHARPVKIVRDIIWVEVDNSSWMHQLQFEKVNILEKLNANLEYTKLKDLKFVVAEPRKDARRPPREKTVFSPVDPQDLEAFERQAGLIEDEASRQALIRLWYLFSACRRE